MFLYPLLKGGCVVQLKLDLTENNSSREVPASFRGAFIAVKLGLPLLLGLALLLFYISIQSTSALSQATRTRHWRVFHEEDGLISNDIWSILIQDDVVWLGTDLGIARYDGEWRNFYNLNDMDAEDEPASGLKRGHVVTLADSHELGALWAGSSEGFISRWDGAEWVPQTQVPAGIYVIHETENGLYIGSSIGLWHMNLDDGGLSYIMALAETAVRAIKPGKDGVWVGTDHGLWHYQDGLWREIPLTDMFSEPQVNALWLDPNGVLWVGGVDGVAWYDPEIEEWPDIILPLNNQYDELTAVLALTGDESGAVWAGSDGGGTRKFINYGLVTTDVSRASGGGLTTPLVSDIAIDDDGSVWFATPVGLFQYQDKIWFNDFQARDGIEPNINAINDLLVDRNNGIWIATDGGGVRRKLATEIGYQEELFTTENGDLPSDHVYALAEDAVGGIWAGTFAGPVRYVDDQWVTPIDALELSSPVTLALLADSGGVWIGTEAGLAFYDLASDQVAVAPGLEHMTIEALVKDSLGQLWVGTRSSGILLLRNNGQWRRFLHDPKDAQSFPDAGVMATGLTPDLGMRGGMWAIAPVAGLLHWDGQRWSEGDPEHNLPDNLLYRIYTDRSDGTLWVGSETGVSHFDGLTWGVFSIEDGLQSTAIYAIVQEKDGAYWFGGPEGLTRYWPEQTPPWVRAMPLAGIMETDDGLEATLNGNVEIGLTYGDLQAPANRVDLFYRTDADTAWQELESTVLKLAPSTLGEHSIEFMARDPAFNYSQPVTQAFTVVNPPRVTTLPFLGEVEQGVFWTLLLLAGTALLGFTYVSIEIIQNQRRITDAVNRGYNPYVSGDPVRSEEMFFGRHQTVQRIVDTLHNNSIMIHGERRIGKTTLLYQLAGVLRDVDDPEYWFVPVYVDLEGTPEEEFFHFLIEEIARGLVNSPFCDGQTEPIVEQLQYHDIPASVYRDRDFSYDIRTVIKFLQACGDEKYPGKRPRIILLMDEMDVLSRYDHVLQQQLRRIFMRDFSSTLGAVVAGIQISKEWDRVESPWFNLFNEVAIEPFSREDGIKLLTEPVRDIYHYDADAVDFILEASAGRPFRIQQYALESVNQMLATGRRRITLDDVENAHERLQSSYSAEYTDAGLSPKPKAAADGEIPAPITTGNPSAQDHTGTGASGFRGMGRNQGDPIPADELAYGAVEP